jgi:hypothetical protein
LKSVAKVEALVQHLGENKELAVRCEHIDFTYLRNCLYMNDFDELDTYPQIIEDIVSAFTIENSDQ